MALALTGCDAIVVVDPNGNAGTAGSGVGSSSGGTSTTSSGDGAGGGFPPDDYDGYAACFAACEADRCIGNVELCSELCFEDIFPGCGPESLDYHRCANAYCDPDSNPEEDCVEQYEVLRNCKTNLACDPVECSVTGDDCVCSNDCEAGHTRRSECTGPDEEFNNPPLCQCFFDGEPFGSCSMIELVCSEHACCADYW